MNKIIALHELGQSVWLDFISRELLTSGELKGLIEKDEVRGVTSNPSIFEQAIAKTSQYTDEIHSMSTQGRSPGEILDSLILEDIQAAADLFLHQYLNTNSADGYVSIEVNPDLANDTGRTIDEVRRIWANVDRPNVMIKIPATESGIPAIQTAISEGINVNITLIFSLDRYAKVMEAYLSGLEIRQESGFPIGNIASVASFFVSRIDTAVDEALKRIQKEGEKQELSDLFGKAAIASAKLAYQRFQSTFGTSRFGTLSDLGAKIQRPLWASTSTKNPAYPDTYYVDNLIGPQTVNTLPPVTLDAFRDHGTAEITIGEDLELAENDIVRIENAGISMEAITTQLEKEGVEKFAKSFHNLVRAVESQVQS
jgi:transaldolase